MGTHDITILTQSEGIFEVKATSGDTHLGGEDIDNLLTVHCLEEFHKKHHVDLSSNPKARRRLQTACERAKRTLSSQMTASIEVDSLYEGIDFVTTLTRARFEALCQPIFRRTIAPIDDALRTARLDKSQIQEVILVGGSTRIPKVREMLSEYFNGKQLNMSVNPDEAVAYGASVQAAIIAGDKSDVLSELVILDATPLTLGIETMGRVMTPMIPRGTTIPTKKTNVFSTASDNQPACTICVYEGERALTSDCNKLGEFTLSGIPPAPRGIPQIEITYDVDANSILNVTAMEKTTGTKMSITIKSERRSKEDIDHMVHEAEKFAKEDTHNKEKIEAKHQLEGYIYHVKNSLKDVKDKVDSTDYSALNQTVEETIEWLNHHPDSEKAEYDQRREEVDKTVNPIMMKFYQASGTSSGGSVPPAGYPGTGSSRTGEQRTTHTAPKIEEVD